MNPGLRRAAMALFVCLVITFPILAQSQVLEKDVRAELSFLASDALQGRGSGTTYERIAAEYIGSQFRQFGLEPGGDTDSAGNKSFVQRVGLESVKFVEPPAGTKVEFVGRTTAEDNATWNAIGILRGSDPTA